MCESGAGGPPADPSGIMCVFCACTMMREKRKKTEASISKRVCFICLHLSTYPPLVLKEPGAKISNYIQANLCLFGYTKSLSQEDIQKGGGVNRLLKAD